MKNLDETELNLSPEELKARLLSLRETFVSMAAERERTQQASTRVVQVEHEESHLEIRVVLKQGRDAAKVVLCGVESALDCVDHLIHLAPAPDFSEKGVLAWPYNEGVRQDCGMFLRELDALARDATWNGVRLFDGSAPTLSLPAGEQVFDLPLIDLRLHSLGLADLLTGTSETAAQIMARLQLVRARLLNAIDRIEPIFEEFGRRGWSLGI